MNRLCFLVVSLVLLAAIVALADDNAPVPLTAVNVHSLGPERIGNLPAIVAPPDNPQTAAKILLGKKLYFDTRLSADNTVSCATCHDPAMGWSDAGPTSKGIRGQLGAGALRRLSTPLTARCNSGTVVHRVWKNRQRDRFRIRLKWATPTKS